MPSALLSVIQLQRCCLTSQNGDAAALACSGSGDALGHWFGCEAACCAETPSSALEDNIKSWQASEG